MFLNQRSIAILKQLIQSSEASFEVGDLADHFNVSERSIRNDLESVDYYLKMKKLPLLTKETRIQISIDKKELNKDKQLQLLNDIERSEKTLSTLERRDWIFVEVLLQMSIIDIQYLVDLLKVSRSTIISDIRSLKEQLSKEEIELEYQTQQGYLLTGKEWLIRRKGISILSKQGFLQHYLEECILENKWKIFTLQDFGFVENLITDIEKQLKKTYSGDAFSNLINGVLISISRITQAHRLNPLEESETLANKEYKVLNTRAKDIERKFNITIPKQEVWFLMNLFIEGNLLKSEQFFDGNWIELYLFTHRFIEEMSRKLSVSLQEDQELFHALVLHLGPALNRLENEVFLKNEIIQQIQEMYADLFVQVGDTLQQLSSEKNITFTNNEIGFITLHIASALEKVTMMVRRPNVVIICNYGIGTSKLLQTRIEKYFSFNIVGPFSVRDLNKGLLVNNQIDLIISTVAIKNDYSIPVMEVSPLLTSNEIQLLKEYEEDYFSDKTKKKMPERQECYKPRLSDLLRKETVETDVKVSSWEEAIRYGGNLLKEQGLIEERYIDEMIHAVNELGNYMVITVNTAMPHASPDDGVNEIGMSFITLTEPVVFGGVKNDLVKTVICLAAVDASSHLNALQELVDILNDARFTELLARAGSAEDILEFVKEGDYNAE